MRRPKSFRVSKTRVLRDAVRRHEPVAISAITLLEIAVLFGEANTRSDIPLDGLLSEIDSHPAFQIVPRTVEVAAEVAALGGSLRDPAERAIVATARARELQRVPRPAATYDVFIGRPPAFLWLRRNSGRR